MPDPSVVDPEALKALPPWAQFGLYAALGIGAVAGWARRYGKGYGAPAQPSNQVVLEQASLADMAPLRELVRLLKERAETDDAVAELLRMLIAEVKNLTTIVGGEIESRATENEIERRAEIRAAQLIADRRSDRRRAAASKP